MRVFQHADAQPFGVTFPVLAPVYDLSLPAARFIDVAPHLAVESTLHQAGTQQFRALADHFLGGVAGNGGERRVDETEFLLGIRHRDAFVDAVEDMRIQHQILRRGTALGDVAHER